PGEFPMKLKFMLAASAALALGACGSSDDASPPDVLATDSGVLADANAAAASALPTDAQSFVDTASASDMYEVEAGKLAQTMGTAQAVKDFGKTLETDHTKSTADLKAAAAQVDGVA